MDDLERRLDTMKRELDALQIHVMKEVPWYKKHAPLIISLAVSLLAVALSFWTFHQSERRVELQDRHAARAELRGLIQRLEALPRETFELGAKYQDNPDARTRLTADLVTERDVVGQQAIELARQLKGDVTASEYYAIVASFIEANELAGLEELIDEGLAVANDAVSEVVLLRQSGTIKFESGDVAGGRARYSQALKVFEKYPGHTEFYVRFSDAITHTFWAREEANSGNCDEAWREVALARLLIGNDGAVTDASAKVEASCGPQD
jgi:hypothetical protein